MASGLDREEGESQPLALRKGVAALPGRRLEDSLHVSIETPVSRIQGGPDKI